MSQKPEEIRSGQFSGATAMRDYRAEQFGEILIERVIWDAAEPLVRYGVVIGGVGYIWFRFWLPRLDQVVERYYAPDGKLAGTQIDVCMAMSHLGGAYRATDLLLDLWLEPNGRVTLHNEAAFEQAAAEGRLSQDEVEHAERHLRALTAAIAGERFPPALVRNWQIDPTKIREAGGSIALGGSPAPAGGPDPAER